MKRSSFFFAAACLFGAVGMAAQPVPAKGPGCTTATMIDWDCDGYGPGSPLGPDADDNDRTVNTSDTAVKKHGDTKALLAHLGYNPQRLIFISVNGNDKTGKPNLEDHPYRSWNRVAGMVHGGDAVIWRAGTYPDFPSLSNGGNRNSPLILMAYPGERAILDRVGDGITFVGQSHIVVDGLTLTDSAGRQGNGFFFGEPATNITVRNVECYVKGRGVLGMNDLSNILIERSTFHDLTMEHAIYLGARERPNIDITVRYNLLYRADYTGFQHNGRVKNLVVDSNIIHSNRLSGLSFLQGVSNSTIKNNLIFGNERNCMVVYDYHDASPQIAPYDQANNSFIHNTCWVGAMNREGEGISQPAILLDNGGFPVSMDNNRFENNIFVTQNYAVFRFQQPRFLNTAIIRNNVILNRSSDKCLEVEGKEYDFNTLNTHDSLKGGNIQADPKFAAVRTEWYAAPDKYDFTLQPSSPAKGKSGGEAVPRVDIRNQERGAAPDWGAYQTGRQEAAELHAK